MPAADQLPGGLHDDQTPQYHRPMKASELIKTLTGYAERYEREHGYRLEAMTLPRATWLAVGESEIAAGVRITPTDDAGAPVPPMGG